MAFNEAQAAAIAHRDGPALVLAGPGSGKTTVITHRIRKLLTDYHIPGKNILVITFTRAAAEQMRSRFTQMMSGDACCVTFGTFHSVFYRILRYAYQYNASNILSEKEQLHILEELIDSQDMDVPDFSELITNLLAEFSSVKNNSLNLDYYYAKSCSEEMFRRLFRQYEQKLRSMGKVDFDDILSMTLELLEKRPDIRRAWQEQYRYILIDEFQDINLTQYRTIRLLAAPRNNLFVVGDDDQSVYRFRGARPEIMLGFTKDYPDAKKLLLNINYRCDAYIAAAAGHLIRHNHTRFPKDIRAFHSPRFPVQLKCCRDNREQNRLMIRQIQDYFRAGYPYESIAVLFRTNLGGRFMTDALMKAGIPFHMKDTLPNLFCHWIALDIIAYLQIVSEMGNSRANWLRIMNRPNRYLKREALAPCSGSVSVSDFRRYYHDRDWMLERLERLDYDIRIMKLMAPYAAIHYISNAMHYQDYLTEYAREHHIKESELLDILSSVQESSLSFKTCEEWFSYIDRYGEELKKQAAKGNQSGEGVCLCTLHCAKGLEYPIVLIPDINEENIPHARATLDADLEEERRLFYVGLTRAREHLHLYCLKEDGARTKPPSRFLKELNKQ